MDWAEVKEAWIKLNEERKERGVVVEWKKKNGTNHASLYYHCVRSFFFIHSSPLLFVPFFLSTNYNGMTNEERKWSVNWWKGERNKERGVFLCALCFSFASHDFVLSLQIIEAKGTQRTKQRITGNRIVSDVVSFVLLLSLFMLQLQANRNKRVNWSMSERKKNKAHNQQWSDERKEEMKRNHALTSLTCVLSSLSSFVHSSFSLSGVMVWWIEWNEEKWKEGKQAVKGERVFPSVSLLFIQLTTKKRTKEEMKDEESVHFTYLSSYFICLLFFFFLSCLLVLCPSCFSSLIWLTYNGN